MKKSQLQSEMEVLTSMAMKQGQERVNRSGVAHHMWPSGDTYFTIKRIIRTFSYGTKEN